MLQQVSGGTKMTAHSLLKDPYSEEEEKALGLTDKSARMCKNGGAGQP